MYAGMVYNTKHIFKFLYQNYIDYYQTLTARNIQESTLKM